MKKITPTNSIQVYKLSIFNPKSMKVMGIWQWFPRFQGNIASLSSYLLGLPLPCRGKAFSVSSHSSQRLSSSVSNDPTSTRNMSRLFKMKFSFLCYTDFYLLVDLHMDIQAYMQQIFFFFCEWIVNCNAISFTEQYINSIYTLPSFSAILVYPIPCNALQLS